MAGPVGNFRSAKGSRIVVDDFPLTESKWEVHETGVNLPTVNFECFTTLEGSTGAGGGRSFYQGLIGVEKAEGSASGNYDFAQNPFEIPGIFNRDDGPAIQCWLERVGPEEYVFPVSLIYDCADIACDVNAVVTYAWKWNNQGSYFRPTGDIIG